jgi:hypothetical protein
MKNKTRASTSSKHCQQKCQLIQKCLFYVYDSSKKICSLYSTPYKDCTHVVGIPERVIEECKRKQSKSIFLTNIASFLSNIVSNFVQLCPTLSNFVQLWPTLANFGRFCPTLINFVQLCPTLANFGQLWPTLANFVQLNPT